jgi:hypothetical protein
MIEQIMQRIEDAVSLGYERPRNEQLKLLRKLEQVVNDHIYGNDGMSGSCRIEDDPTNIRSDTVKPSSTDNNTTLLSPKIQFKGKRIEVNKPEIVTTSDALKDRMRAFDQPTKDTINNVSSKAPMCTPAKSTNRKTLPVNIVQEESSSSEHHDSVAQLGLDQEYKYVMSSPRRSMVTNKLPPLVAASPVVIKDSTSRPLAPSTFYTPKAMGSKSLHASPLKGARRASMSQLLVTGSPMQEATKKSLINDWTKDLKLKPTPIGNAIKAGADAR